MKLNVISCLIKFVDGRFIVALFAPEMDRLLHCWCTNLTVDEFVIEVAMALTNIFGVPDEASAKTSAVIETENFPAVPLVVGKVYFELSLLLMW